MLFGWKPGMYLPAAVAGCQAWEIERLGGQLTCLVLMTLVNTDGLSSLLTFPLSSPLPLSWCFFRIPSLPLSLSLSLSVFLQNPCGEIKDWTPWRWRTLQGDLLGCRSGDLLYYFPSSLTSRSIDLRSGLERWEKSTPIFFICLVYRSCLCPNDGCSNFVF